MTGGDTSTVLNVCPCTPSCHIWHATQAVPHIPMPSHALLRAASSCNGAYLDF